MCFNALHKIKNVFTEQCSCNEVKGSQDDEPGNEMEDERRSFVCKVAQIFIATIDGAFLDSVSMSFVFLFTCLYFILTIFRTAASFAN
jgi:hypothetical protein